MREPVFTETMQVALVVRDLEAALRTYVHEYGIGPWAIYEFNPETVEDMVKDGEPAEYAFRLALAMVGWRSPLYSGDAWKTVTPVLKQLRCLVFSAR